MAALDAIEDGGRAADVSGTADPPLFTPSRHYADALTAAGLPVTEIALDLWRLDRSPAMARARRSGGWR
jgi:hypothetical protein